MSGVTALIAGFATLSSPASISVLTALLSLTFLWSGIAKLRSPYLASLALVDFGATRRSSIAAVRVLAAVECGLALGIAASQELGWFGRVVCWASVGLLSVFTLAVIRLLRRGVTFACFCFGPGSKLSRVTIVRNVALLCAAIFVASGPPAAAPQGDVLASLVLGAAILGICIAGAESSQVVKNSRELVVQLRPRPEDNLQWPQESFVEAGT